MKIGILNGGGDCAGLNAVTRSVLKNAENKNYTVIGIFGGWGGLLEKRFKEITYKEFEDTIATGGTLLKTSRVNPLKKADGLETIISNIKKAGIDALIVVGGDDTLGVAVKLSEKGVNVIGVPKTMDNDLSGTDYSFGFFSAVDEATRMLDSLATISRSHERVMVAEIMGRDAGWVAAFAGIAAGANAILVPEFKTDLKDVYDMIKKRHKEGKRNALIVVAEGVNLGSNGATKKDEFDHVVRSEVQESNAAILARFIEEKTGIEARPNVFGHAIRGGAPDSYDRIMTTMLGARAVEAIHKKKFGVMVAIRGTKIVEVPIAEASKKKFLDKDVWDVAKGLFG